MSTPDLADTPAPDLSANRGADPGHTPQPAVASSPAPGRSPSVPPTPARVAAARSPTSQATGDVVAVSLAKDNRIALVDAVTGKVIQLVDLSEPAGRMTMAPDGHSAWVFKPQPRQPSVALFDVLTGDKHEDIHFHEGDSPSAVVFAADGTRAYVAMGGDQLTPPGPGAIAFATSSGKEYGRVTVGRQTKGVQIRRRLSSVAIGPGPDGDVLFAAGDTSGVVWALDAGSGAILNEVDVGGGPTSIVVDSARQRAYALLDTVNQVVAIDTTTLAVTKRLDLPAHPIGGAIGPAGTLYVTGGDTNGEVWVVEPNVTEIRSRGPIGGRPVALAISSDGKSLYIPDGAAPGLSIVSADTIQVTRSIPLASEPLDVLAVNAAKARTRAPLALEDPAHTTSTPTPQLAPTPTPLPEGAQPPDQLPPGAIAEPFVTGAALPVVLAFAPDGRLFYNELRTGRIRIVQNGTLLPDPFYQLLIADQPDAGLLGLTLDPNFQDNHYVYIFYTAPNTKGDGAANGPNAVVRLTDNDNKGTDLTPVLQDLPSAGAHNSGALGFGPDGKLYVSLGDDDRGTSAQDLSTLGGKILRVNPDGSIPTDNPFAGQTDKQGAIWAYGFHNAYSFAFQPLGHQLLAVESGAAASDALDLIVRGANYGWSGAGNKPGQGVNSPLAVINPAIRPTGSTFYTADQMPDWKNDWFYCNSDQKQLRRVRLAPVSFDRVVFEEVVKLGCAYGVATGPDGALYYSDAQGIYRIRVPGADVLPPVKMDSAPASGLNSR